MADEPRISIPITNSEPPQAKLIAARGMAWQMVIAQFAELIGMIVLAYCLVSGKLSEGVFAGLFGYCLTGNIVQKVRGKSPLPTTAVIGAASLWMLHASAPLAVLGRTFLATALLVITLQGCAGAQLREPNWVQVRQDANDMRTVVNHAVDDMTALVPAVGVVCALRGDLSGPCLTLRGGYEAGRQAVIVARSAIDAFDETAIAAEGVHAAVARVQSLANMFAAAATDALNEVQHDVGSQAPGTGDGAREAAPKTQASPAQGAGPPDATVAPSQGAQP